MEASLYEKNVPLIGAVFAFVHLNRKGKADINEHILHIRTNIKCAVMAAAAGYGTSLCLLSHKASGPGH